ncbi:hypothetical protein QM467_12295 [Rhodoblastus sp. 17X3]|uniref:hypothetical protein n=1 Tax=Rhodoblastus sp. 17X3 TaxID=3047026 RepID=UPI0024B763B4|nr:hypothetical protein [Rhodoblastus sp. 17X3]MDI9848838.1 hypothetical protein [Rhodoblastus sp. 17X3]
MNHKTKETRRLRIGIDYLDRPLGLAGHLPCEGRGDKESFPAHLRELEYDLKSGAVVPVGKSRKGSPTNIPLFTIAF